MAAAAEEKESHAFEIDPSQVMCASVFGIEHVLDYTCSMFTCS